VRTTAVIAARWHPLSAPPTTRIQDIQHPVEADAGSCQELAHNLSRRRRAPGEERLIVGDQRRPENSRLSISPPAHGSTSDALGLGRRQLQIDPWPELLDDARRVCPVEGHD